MSIRYILYSLFLVFTVSSWAQNESAEDLTKQIQETYVKVFKDKLLLKKIDPTDWNELVARIGVWVRNKTNDTGLQKDYIQLSEISNDVISGCKLLYNLTSYNTEQAIDALSTARVMQSLLASNKTNNKLAENIDNTVYFWGSKRQVQSLLLQLSKTLNAILTEVITMYKISFFVHKRTKK